MDANDIPSRNQLIDEAAIWYAELDSGVANVGKFEAWRDANPRHALAFAQVLGTLMLLDKVRDGREADIATEVPGSS